MSESGGSIFEDGLCFPFWVSVILADVDTHVVWGLQFCSFFGLIGFQIIFRR